MHDQQLVTIFLTDPQDKHKQYFIFRCEAILTVHVLALFGKVIINFLYFHLQHIYLLLSFTGFHIQVIKLQPKSPAAGVLSTCQYLIEEGVDKS